MTTDSLIDETGSTEPKPGEIWVTRSGRYVMTAMMSGPEIGDQTLGFVWYDETDREMTICPISTPLHKKSTMTIAEWGLMINDLVQ